MPTRDRNLPAATATSRGGPPAPGSGAAHGEQAAGDWQRLTPHQRRALAGLREVELDRGGRDGWEARRDAEARRGRPIRPKVWKAISDRDLNRVLPGRANRPRTMQALVDAGLVEVLAGVGVDGPRWALTSRGRAAARHGRGERPDPPPGTYTAWTWRWLLRLYLRPAGSDYAYAHRIHAALGPDRAGRRATPLVDVDHDTGMVVLTAAGRAYVEAHRERYQSLYPEIEGEVAAQEHRRATATPSTPPPT